MISDMLSQDEIDALLNQKDDSEESSEESADTSDVAQYFSDIEQDAIGEIGNIKFGSSSTALSTLLNQKVDITTPSLSIITRGDLEKEFPKPHVAIHVKYTEGFKGVNMLIIKMEDAAIIADLMLGGDGTNPNMDLSEMHLSAVQEAMNQMMGSAATSMSTMFNERVDISPPGIDVYDFSEDELKPPLDEEDKLLNVAFRMKIGDLIDSYIMQLLPINFAKEMVNMLLHPGGSSAEASEQVQGQPSDEQPMAQPSAQESMANEQPAFSETQQASVPPRQPMAPPTQPTYQQPAANHTPMDRHQQANVQAVQFSQFDADQQSSTDIHNLDLLMDIPLQVTVELGRTKRVVKDILELSQGSILELDKIAGEPVDIFVNQKLIAKGEVVVIEENFGVRVTDILSQKDRLQNLK